MEVLAHRPGRRGRHEANTVTVRIVGGLLTVSRYRGRHVGGYAFLHWATNGRVFLAALALVAWVLLWPATAAIALALCAALCWTCLCFGALWGIYRKAIPGSDGAATPLRYTHLARAGVAGMSLALFLAALAIVLA